MNYQYILLTKHATRSGDITNWEVFFDLDSAKVRLEDYQKTSKQYEHIPLIAPMLVQATIVKVEVVL